MATPPDKPSRQHPPKEQSHQPGRQHKMHPQPQIVREGYVGSNRLANKTACITGGDSGIGQAVAGAFALEGADVAVVYLEETRDAERTRELVEQAGRRCVLIQGDVADEAFCRQAVERTAAELGRLDILVNNAGEQHPTPSLEKISKEQLERTFATNIFAMFYLTKAALPHLKARAGSCIINTASVTAYRGAAGLLDYSATKGAIVAFTRSLSQNLADDHIRVNAVAPGPIWTPLIPATFPQEKLESFGEDVAMKRAGQPWECAGCYVFLAGDDASYMTGQVLHPNGGEIING